MGIDGEEHPKKKNITNTYGQFVRANFHLKYTLYLTLIFQSVFIHWCWCDALVFARPQISPTMHQNISKAQEHRMLTGQDTFRRSSKHYFVWCSVFSWVGCSVAKLICCWEWASSTHFGGGHRLPFLHCLSSAFSFCCCRHGLRRCLWWTTWSRRN